MRDHTSFIFGEPIARNLGLTIENKGPSNARHNLPHNNPAKTLINQQPQTSAHHPQHTPHNNASPRAISINDIGGRKGEYGVHQGEEQGAEVYGYAGNAVDLGQEFGDGVQGSQQDGRH